MVLGTIKTTKQYHFSNTHSLHPCLDIMSVTEAKKIPKSVYNRNKERRFLQRHNICLTESDHYLFIYEIKRRDTIE